MGETRITRKRDHAQHKLQQQQQHTYTCFKHRYQQTKARYRRHTTKPVQMLPNTLPIGILTTTTKWLGFSDAG